MTNEDANYLMFFIMFAVSIGGLLSLYLILKWLFDVIFPKRKNSKRNRKRLI